MSNPNHSRADVGRLTGGLHAFASPVVDAVRKAGNVMRLPGGTIFLPRVFGFCRGVGRALASLQMQLDRPGEAGRIVLLGQIIHNPWVNRYFSSRGVVILDGSHRQELSRHISAGDTAVIPAFGVPPQVEDDLAGIGCKVIDCSCPDVRRLWEWSARAARDGFAVAIFGRAEHDETVVTKGRLERAGGKYIVLGGIDDVEKFADTLAGGTESPSPTAAFGRSASNAGDMAAFDRLAQVSQTTMLYDQTLQVRRMLNVAFERKFGPAAAGRLIFQPTVCQATQNRQNAAVELCKSGLDLAVVVGGFDSSNTRHLHALAQRHCPAWLIEDDAAFQPDGDLMAFDIASGRAVRRSHWLPAGRPVRLGLLAGASTPEIVVGLVIKKLAGLLA
ncbi:MAG: 4-hydroxy-3-methylbut-2-enyl diphosphate reductase [Planctomycetes bacterium]|nr:4-hydroxy-3-methylbut-2-enyl diphosphate reductase [Planctomycetota bacterium]